MRQSLRSIALFAALLGTPGCFWGQADADMFFKVSGANSEQYKELLYPADRAQAWSDIFTARPVVCSDGTTDCGIDGTERSDLVDLYLPYKTESGRGLITQKGDLQITTHLNVGEAYQALVDEDLSGWNYMDDSSKVYGWSGDSCSLGDGATSRSGVGRCLKKELADNSAGYTALDEDLRLVILINLLSQDDVRSTDCQDALTRPAWELPKTLRVNYNANQPQPRVEGDDSSGFIYGADTSPLLQCDIEVFARLQMGIERFEADYYGEQPDLQSAQDNAFTLDRVNEPGSTLRGTVELESLQLPDEGDDPRAVGRFEMAFTSDRFGGRDGTVIVSGTFNVEIHKDAERLQEPARETQIGGFGAGDPGT